MQGWDSASAIFFWRWRKYVFFHLKIGQYIHYMTCMWCASLLIFTLYKIMYMIALHTYIYIYITTLLLCRFQPYFLFRCFRFTKASPQSYCEQHSFYTTDPTHGEDPRKLEPKADPTHRGHHHLLVHRFPCLAADSTRCFFSLRQWKCQCTAEAQSGGDLGRFSFLVGNKKGWNVFFFFVVVGNPVKKRVWARYNILLEYSIWSLYIYIYLCTQIVHCKAGFYELSC